MRSPVRQLFLSVACCLLVLCATSVSAYDDMLVELSMRSSSVLNNKSSSPNKSSSRIGNGIPVSKQLASFWSNLAGSILKGRQQRQQWCWKITDMNMYLVREERDFPWMITWLLFLFVDMIRTYDIIVPFEYYVPWLSEPLAREKKLGKLKQSCQVSCSPPNFDPGSSLLLSHSTKAIIQFINKK